MTTQGREKIDYLKGGNDGMDCWIVGTGPSIDDIDLSRIPRVDHTRIFALNGAILWFDMPGDNAWWVFTDKRVLHEIGGEVQTFKTLRCLCYKQTMEMMRSWRCSGRWVEYSREAFRQKRTCAETAILLARYLGFSRAFLVGVDGFATKEDARPYTRKLPVKRKRCYFMEEGVLSSNKNSMRDMTTALNALSTRIGSSMEVYQTSPIAPSLEFGKRIDFYDAVSKSERARRQIFTPPDRRI